MILILLIFVGMNFTVSMVETTKVFQKMGAHLTNRHLPGCERFPLKSMEYYECFARHLTLTVYHQSGTCSMGKSENGPKTVVDSKLRLLKKIKHFILCKTIKNTKRYVMVGFSIQKDYVWWTPLLFLRFRIVI